MDMKNKNFIEKGENAKYEKNWKSNNFSYCYTILRI